MKRFIFSKVKNFLMRFHTLGLTFFLLLLSLSIVNAQENVTNATDICQTCTPIVCAHCVPKKWTDYLNPSEFLSSIIGWILKAVGLKLPIITISLISFLIIAVTLWILAKKFDTILLIIVVLLIVLIVVTAILYMVSPNIIQI